MKTTSTCSLLLTPERTLHQERLTSTVAQNLAYKSVPHGGQHCLWPAAVVLRLYTYTWLSFTLNPGKKLTRIKIPAVKDRIGIQWGYHHSIPLCQHSTVSMGWRKWLLQSSGCFCGVRIKPRALKC